MKWKEGKNLAANTLAQTNLIKDNYVHHSSQLSQMLNTMKSEALDPAGGL